MKRLAGAVAVLAFLLIGVAAADTLLVLKDGRKIAVTRLARRDGQVLFQTTKGENFSVPEAQVVSPPLDSIPAAGASAAPAEPTASEGQTLVLKDGRRIPYTRIARRDGQVLFQTTKGENFSVPEAQVLSPPLDSIPAAGAAAAPPATEAQTLVLKDGRRIPVTRLIRRGGVVLLETTKGERFSVAEDQVVSPPLDSIPSAEGPTPPVAAPEAATPPVAPPPAMPTTPGPKVAAAAPAPASEPDFEPLPDRWSIAYPEDPRIVRGRTIDPYNQNRLKGDKPIFGNSTFLVLTAILDAPVEDRRLPVPGGVSTANPATFEFFGQGNQLFTTPRALLSAELFSGQTAFKPKTWAFKTTAALNLNYLKVKERNLVTVDVRDDLSRRRQDFSLEEAFGEVKLATISRNYDFVSLRAGIQPFVSDFRGLIFSDFNLGARLFGSVDANRWQWNAAYFDLLEKETNSELNTFEKREQKVLIANVFRQDFLTPGYTVSGSFHWSKDEPNIHYDTNGVLTRPAPVGFPRQHEVEPKYLGLAGDGHVGRLNLSHAFYYAFGEDELNVVAGRKVDIKAFLGAAELSYDKDWARFKGTFFYASGDDTPLDETASGFDNIDDNSNFAGGPFSFWSRSAIALTQTKVLLKGPNTLLPNLRSNKFEGQSNFVNPGLVLLGFGVDLEVTPKIKGVMNANYLRFATVAPLKTLLFQSQISEEIGFDLGAGVIYRPLLNENVVVTAGVTGLVSGKGFDDIYSSATCGAPDCGFEKRNLMNVFLNVRLAF